MELASMLAGESFSDHPRCASRTVAAFLRCYNDALNSKRRQDLYEYAAKVVGSTSSPEVESARVVRLMQWADGRRLRRTRWPLPARCRRLTEPHRRVTPESAARYAIRSIHRVSDETHANVLALIDELIAYGKQTDGEVFDRGPDASARTRIAPAR